MSINTVLYSTKHTRAVTHTQTIGYIYMIYMKRYIYTYIIGYASIMTIYQFIIYIYIYVHVSE